MIINAQALQSMYRSFRAIAMTAMTASQPQYTRVATVIPSSAKEEEYGWLGNLPKMREWIGERFINALAAHGFSIKNKPWELTIEVDRDDVEDDRLGVYKPLFEMMGQSAAIHPDELVFALLKNGFTSLCYDGQYFFDEDHKAGGDAVQSNKTDLVLSAEAYAAARAAMMSLKDEHGKPLRITPDLLVVGPSNDELARRILFAEQINGTTNTMRNTAELLTVPDLDAEWFLLSTKMPLKPIIFQQRKKPEFVGLDRPDDENVFMRKKFIYGMDSRDNAGYGLWQLAYGSTGTDDGSGQ